MTLADDIDPWDMLQRFGRELTDAEKLRIIVDNQRGARVRDGDPNADAVFGPVVDLLKAEEKARTRDLIRAFREIPDIPAFVKSTFGLGEKSVARLLAETGALDARSAPSQLWAYCGFDGDRRSFKHNRYAKMRAFLVAEPIIKVGGPYRVVYDEARVKYADAIHDVECRRCGPSGSPAAPGTPLSLGHQHARAMRLVSKAVLLDLWKVSRGHGLSVAHMGLAA